MRERDKPFWKAKSLGEMTTEEWESVCDGCGRCCLEKLEDTETGEIIFTNVACNLLDTDSCRCTAYLYRTQLMPDCLVLTPGSIKDTYWLPPTCAYRLLAESKELEWWHHLISGDADTVREAGVSGTAIHERSIRLEQLDAYTLEEST